MAEEAHAVHLRRLPGLGRTVGALSRLHLLGLALVATTDPASSEVLARWRSGLAMTHTARRTVGLLSAAGASWLKARVPGRGRGRPQIFGLLGPWTATGIAMVDQLVTSNITLAVLSPLAVAPALNPRPRWSFALFSANHLLLFATLPWTPPDPTLLLSNRLAALGDTVVAVGLPSALCRNVATITLHRRALAEANAGLRLRQEALAEASRRDGRAGLPRSGPRDAPAPGPR